MQRNLIILLKIAFRLVAGYVAAIVAGAVLYGFILSAYDALALSGEGWDWEGLGGTIALSILFGSIFGLPYTIVGSLLVRFVLPQNKLIFLFVGMFCPASALLFLYWVTWSRGNTDFPYMIAWSFPPGVLSAYVYGAIGFGYGFGRWSPAHRCRVKQYPAHSVLCPSMETITTLERE